MKRITHCATCGRVKYLWLSRGAVVCLACEGSMPGEHYIALSIIKPGDPEPPSLREMPT